MKTVYLFLVASLLALTACGAPFEAGLGDDGSGLSGAAGSVGTAGSAGVIGAGSGPSAEAGAAGESDVGAAGASDAAGAGGEAPVSAGGSTATGSAGSAGAGGAVVPPPPPCSPSLIVTGQNSMPMGTIAECLRTSAPIDYLACSNWDSREIRINGRVMQCWVKFPVPPAIGGYWYIETTPGNNAMALLDWSFV